MVDESYWFYDGTVQLKFNKDEHKYYRVGELGQLIPLEGVTTVCHILDKSNALVPWCAKVVTEKLLRLMPTEFVDGVIRVKGIPLEQFSTYLTEAKTAHKDALEDSADVGSMAHNWLELYIRALIKGDVAQQEALLARKCTDERATSCVNAALLWMKKHNVRWIETERKIFSLEHGFAGTMDGLCLVDSCDDPTCCQHSFKDRLSVADWKSSNYLYLEYLLQTAAYEAAYEEEHKVDIKDRWILRLGKEDGNFDAWHCEEEDFAADFDAYLTCLKLCRLRDHIEERMKVQKKLIKALKKEAKVKAKQVAKEQAKLQKALEKAERKRVEKEEKERIKAEAKKRREEEKAAKKAAVVAVTKTQEDVCAGLSEKTTMNSGKSDTTFPATTDQCSTSINCTLKNITQNASSTTSTEDKGSNKVMEAFEQSTAHNHELLERLADTTNKFFEAETEAPKRILIPEE